MIKKLQRKFILIALVALTVAMVLVVLVVNAANWISVRNELDATLSFLAEIKETPEKDSPEKESPEKDSPDRDVPESRPAGKTKHARNLVSESNWFSVTFDADWSVCGVNLSNMTDPDEETARSLAAQAVSQSFARSAFLQDYRFLIVDGPKGGQTVVFLNCETKLTAVRTLALISGLACLGGILLAFLLVSLASRKAIEPTVRNMEQQKQFITNASHELKTPLTVISANMDLLQMETPGNPWVKSTQKQAAQMRRLVDELVYLSRMEEENAPMNVESIALKPLLEEAAEPFMAMAEFQGKTLTAQAPDEIRVKGDRAMLQRLLSILLDNAVKYASENGTVAVTARAEGRSILLTAANDVAQPLTGDQCRQLFDRFYRADASRNKEKKSGFGIGLAIAAAIAEKHGGSISAAMEGENRFAVTCKLPKAG